MEEMTGIQENKMGVMPVNKLLVSMSVPMMVSMLISALYNIVDSIFVSRICEDALTAVSMAFPLQCLMMGLGIGTGVGVNALLSRALGARKLNDVNKVAMNGVFLAAVCYVVFLFVGLFAVRPFFASQTDNPEILEYGIQYMTIVCTCSFGLYFQFIFERLLISTGRTVLSMITQSTGAIINIIFDPICIFGLFGVPQMGVAGAAVATVAGQIVAALLALLFNFKKNEEVTLSFKGFKPDLYVIKEIYKIGLPSIVMQAVGSVMNYISNKILIGFTSTAVAVFGVYYKMQSFIFMPIFGLNNGLVPIVSYNFGAANRKRVMKSWKTALVYAVLIMVVGTLLFELIPQYMFMLFDASDSMLSIGIKAFRIIGIHFPVAGYCIITGTMFQALGKSMYTLITSVMRQVVVLIPAAYLLSLLGNVDYVWWAFPIAEIMSAAATTFFFIKLYRGTIINIPLGKE